MGRPLEPVQGILEYEPRGLVEGLTVVSVDLAISGSRVGRRLVSLPRGSRARGRRSRTRGAWLPRGRVGLLLLAGLLPGGAVAVPGFGSLQAAAARLGLGRWGPSAPAVATGEVERPGARAVVRLMCSFARPL